MEGKAKIVSTPWYYPSIWVLTLCKGQCGALSGRQGNRSPCPHQLFFASFNCSSKFWTWGHFSVSQYDWVLSSAFASLSLICCVFNYYINIQSSQENKTINILVVVVVIADRRSRAIFSQGCWDGNDAKHISSHGLSSNVFWNRRAIMSHSHPWSECCFYSSHIASDHGWDLRTASQRVGCNPIIQAQLPLGELSSSTLNLLCIGFTSYLPLLIMV